ncbi:MAG: hypothetical protein IKO31_00605 [Bacteroidales bacterium]|nr:hypothetical protein [Bacteroidales bacterium]
MLRKLYKVLTVTLSIVVASLSVFAQDKVLLIKAKSAQLLDIDGDSYRKVTGPAKFLHNDTYLLCDTAYWNVNTNIIDAMGNVRIIQDRTTLSSNTLQYVVDEDLARFRGDLVQLVDEENNTLRTKYLDYNTKDSVAVFQDGGAMRDKDGQVIESLYGTYDSKAHLFVFNDQVNMYMDTTFIKTSRLEYRSDLSKAWFGFGTDMWQDDQMLSADDGWYDRENELFMFRKKVHTLNPTKETWSDSAYYYRALNDVELLGKVEVMDTVQNMYCLAGYLQWTDSLQRAVLTRDPAIMSIIEEEGQLPDSLYLGADTLIYHAIKRCDIPEQWVKDSQKRLKDIGGDPIMEYRRKAAEAAKQAAEEAAKSDPNRAPQMQKKGKGPGQPKPDAPRPDVPKPEAPGPDSLRTGLPAPPDSVGHGIPDSLGIPPADSTMMTPPADTVPPKDTTKVAFVWGNKKVRMFRRNMQMYGDSLAYSDIDSLARLYRDPIVFSDGNRQYAADSIYMVIRQKRVEKAHLLSNAFITIQEDPVSFDQISGTEVVAHFDSTSALARFDALGGASTIFFLEEEGALATVNKVECKMLYATFTDGEMDHIYYYDSPKNDGYPTVQLPNEERQLKGYRWEPEKRPKSPEDVTLLKPRSSQRTSYLARPHTTFEQTEIYFPGYINKIYRDIAIRDSLEVVRRTAAGAVVDSTIVEAVDSLGTPADTLLSATPVADTTAAAAPAAVAAAASDNPETEETKPQPSAKELKAAEKARKKAEKQKALEAKWAEEDRKWEEKQNAKAARKIEKERAKKRKMLLRLERKSLKEQKIFEKYLAREREKALKKNKTK